MAAKYKKRKDGRYLVQVLIGYKSDGKPKYKNVYAHTVRELEEKAAKIRDEIEKGISVTDERLTVEQWATRWLELYKANVSYNTNRIYASAINVQIIPAIGMYRLKDLKPHHVQELLNSLNAEGKARTAEIVKLTLNQILQQAVKNEYTYKNIMESVSLPKRDKPQKRALTDLEIDIVRNADLPLKEKAFVTLLLTTGLRRGEAVALTKSDVDMENRKIIVNKTAILKGNQMEIKNSPKSEAGHRKVPITNELYLLLEPHLRFSESIYVFPTAKGKFMTDTAFRRMWQKILNALNVAAGGSNGKLKVLKIAQDITPHVFRHTYATLLYRAGVDIKTAQYLLGHATVQVTMDIYTHLDSENQVAATDKFNAFMENDIQSKISQLSVIN